MFSLWTGLECVVLNHSFLKVFFLILVEMEAGVPCRVSKQCVLWCFMHLEGTKKGWQEWTQAFFPLVLPLFQNQIRPTYIVFSFPSVVEKWEDDIANGFTQTDSLQKPLTSCISLGLRFFNRPMGDNIIIRPHRIAVKLIDRCKEFRPVPGTQHSIHVNCHTATTTNHHF